MPDFDVRDNGHSAHVAVINRAAARELFGTDYPVGRTFRTDEFKNEKQTGFDDWEVIGVVGDARYNSLRETPPATVYLPFEQLPWVVASRWLAVKQTGVLLLIGVLIGSALAAGSTKLFAALLYGVRATAPDTFAGPLVAILFIMTLAAVIPARRAVRIDPAAALRDE